MSENYSEQYLNIKKKGKTIYIKIDSQLFTMLIDKIGVEFIQQAKMGLEIIEEMYQSTKQPNEPEPQKTIEGWEGITIPPIGTIEGKLPYPDPERFTKVNTPGIDVITQKNFSIKFEEVP